MSGTTMGGKKAAVTNKTRHGASFYRTIGALGGKKQVPTKGFGTHRELASVVGQRGGRISKRRPAKR